MESKSTIELEFRTGEDLFKNYGIGIIRQVVDKSESQIEEKKEGLRRLVGGKYLDMLSVCDRISEMNKEFGVVRESVDAVLQLCESLGDDYAFVKEIDQKKEKQAEITQESLWEEYDHDEMLALARHLAAFRDSQKTRYSSLNEEFFTELPAIAATKCVSLLLQKEELSGEKQMELFTAFFLFSLFTQPDADVLTLFQRFLSSASDHIVSHASSADLNSFLQKLMEVHRLIQAVLGVMTAEDTYSVFTSNLPAIHPSWREEHRPVIAKSIQDWLEGVLEAVKVGAESVVKPVASVEALANVKRSISETMKMIRADWVQGLCVIFAREVADPLAALFDGLFSSKSQELIRVCFESMCEQARGSAARLSDVSVVYLHDEVNKKVAAPITQLFVDLSDLEYSQNPALVSIVEEETKKLFSVILEACNATQEEENRLATAYVLSVVQEAARGIAESNHINLQNIIEQYQASFRTAEEQWLDSVLDCERGIKDAFAAVRWTMHDAEWYEAISTWKEFSLGAMEGEEEQVLIPGACSPCLIGALTELCHLLDRVRVISSHGGFMTQSRQLLLQSAYHKITAVYNSVITELLGTYPSIASPGLLTVLFDLLFLERVLDAATAFDGVAEDRRVIGELREKVLEEIDPVDWTLAESYMQVVLEEYVSSVALLISPLLLDTYALKNATTMKSLSKNANVIFTPIEKLPSFPISSQSIQLLLQSRMKEQKA